MPSTVAIGVPPGQVKIVETVVFTVPPGHEYDVAYLRICNTDDSEPVPETPGQGDHFVSIYRYSGAGPGSDVNVAFKQQLVQQHATYEFGPFMVPPGGKLTVTGDVDDKMTYTVEGQDKTL
jgi:hypothetical protein